MSGSLHELRFGSRGLVLAEWARKVLLAQV